MHRKIHHHMSQHPIKLSSLVWKTPEAYLCIFKQMYRDRLHECTIQSAYSFSSTMKTARTIKLIFFKSYFHGTVITTSYIRIHADVKYS